MAKMLHLSKPLIPTKTPTGVVYRLGPGVTYNKGRNEMKRMRRAVESAVRAYRVFDVGLLGASGVRMKKFKPAHRILTAEMLEDLGIKHGGADSYGRVKWTPEIHVELLAAHRLYRNTGRWI